MIIQIVLILIIIFIFHHNIYILSNEYIIAFILNDSDEYFKNMSKYDLKARNVKSVKEYKNVIVDEQKYSKYTLSLKDYIVLLLASISADYYFYNLKHKMLPEDHNVNKILWKFGIIKTSKYENSYPHTREDIIFIHISIIKNVNTLKDYYKFVGLLIHEKLHIYQRYNNIAVDKFLEKLNIRHKYHRKEFKLIRANPDLNDWVYQHNDKLMLYEYANEFPKGINDIKKKYSKYEHPYEMISYTIENEYLVKMI